MRCAAFGLPATALFLSGMAAAPALAEPPAPPSTPTARSELAALAVAPPHSMDGYARDKFDIWSTQSDGCTTRQDVLARDGKDVQDKPGRCQPASGSWSSVYDDTTVTDVAQATIDHRPSTTWSPSPRPGARVPTPGPRISARPSETT